MITEDIAHKLGTHHTLSDVKSNESLRNELWEQMAEWEAKGNQIEVVPSSEYSTAPKIFNRGEELNPQKKRKGWSNAGIAKSR